ncbi:MAG: integrase arm-type DNA-binding domain-containing protein [Nitrospirae bacterium]|nr:integrase arm-type DNA-binding domain-containing protein [Nitrospirota bacterium]
MPLTELSIRNARAGEKAARMSDGGGLYLQMEPNGGKYWRLAYRFGGKQKTLALGVYPTITLKDARARRDEARRQLAHGIDPGAHRKEVREREEAQVTTSFESVAREWLPKMASRKGWAESYGNKVARRLEVDLFPWLGGRPVREITPPELLRVLQRIEERGAVNTAHQAKQTCGQIFRYAIATGRATRDPSADLKDALPPARSRHLASITDPKGVGELLRAIDGFKGTFVVQCALRLAPLFFVRPGELRQAECLALYLGAPPVGGAPFFCKDRDAGQEGVAWGAAVPVSGRRAPRRVRSSSRAMSTRRPESSPPSSQAVRQALEMGPLSGLGLYSSFLMEMGLSDMGL